MKNAPASVSAAKLKELRESVAKNPESPECRLNLGTAFLKAGMVHQAEEEIRRAVDLKPDFPEAWSNLGGVSLSRWDFAGCIEANRKALELRPDFVQAHYNMGLGYLYKGDTKEMVVCFRRALELEPENPGANYYLAVGLQAEGELDEARQALARAVALGHTPEPEFMKALESHGPPTPMTHANAKATADPPKLENVKEDGAEAGGAIGPATFEFEPGSKESTK